MNDISATPRMANHHVKTPSMEGLRMETSAGTGRGGKRAICGHSACAGQGNEATAANCEAANLVLESLVAEFERMGWGGHASYVQTMASHMSIYAHQIRARAEQ